MVQDSRFFFQREKIKYIVLYVTFLLTLLIEKILSTWQKIPYDTFNLIFEFFILEILCKYFRTITD